ncbi:MAG: heme exporter protein CcmD [Nevskiales bacterium]
MTFADLFDTAGHGPYILASYGVTFIVLLVNVLAPLLRGFRLRQEIRNQIRARKASQ